MSITAISWGASIVPSTQPPFVFPVVANSIVAALASTGTFTGTSTFTGEGTDAEGAIAISGTDTESGTLTESGQLNNAYVSEAPIAGQLTNLNVEVSIDGAAFAAGEGVLSEVANGYYKYVPKNTETGIPGPVTIRVYPTTPTVVASLVTTYIEETVLTFIVMKPGYPTTNTNPNSPGLQASYGPSIITPLENYIQAAIRDLLGNQLTNKPTFKKDS